MVSGSLSSAPFLIQVGLRGNFNYNALVAVRTGGATGSPEGAGNYICDTHIIYRSIALR